MYICAATSSIHAWEHVVLVFVMNLHVGLQVVISGKLLKADFTLVRFLTCVAFHVPDHVYLLAEAFIATFGCTREWSYQVVGSHMIVSNEPCFESLVTLGTKEGKHDFIRVK